MPPPAPRAPGTSGSDPQSRRGEGGVASQGGGVGKRFRRTSGGFVSSMGKGDVYGMQRRMAAKRERDKATRTKRVRGGKVEAREGGGQQGFLTDGWAYVPR